VYLNLQNLENFFTEFLDFVHGPIISETASVSVLRWNGGEAPTVRCPSEKANARTHTHARAHTHGDNIKLYLV
jgi:hypothetical protein